MTPTPLGHWIIIKKGLWGAQFGGHFMQLNVPWGIYGIHGTDMPSSIAHKELYSIIPVGTAVNIY